MILILTRDIFTDDATLGRLEVDYEKGQGAQDFGFTVEDQDRGLRQAMPLDQIGEIKVPNETAIPTGRYVVRFTYSPKYAEVMRSYGRTDGKMPEVLNVPGFRGVRVHSGNDDDDTAGCILPGMARDTDKMTVSRSRVACAWLYRQIADCEDRSEDVTLIIRGERP